MSTTATATAALRPEPAVPAASGDPALTRANRDHDGSRTGRWLKKVGLAGFAFFFIKGVIWLVVFAMAALKIIGV